MLLYNIFIKIYVLLTKCWQLLWLQKDNVKKPCAKITSAIINDKNASVSQLLFNLSVITLAQGFFMLFLLYIGLLCKTTIFMVEIANA